MRFIVLVAAAVASLFACVASAQTNIAVGMVTATFRGSVPYSLYTPNGSICFKGYGEPSFAYNGKSGYTCPEQIGMVTYGQCEVRFFNAQPSYPAGSLFTIAATLVSSNANGSWCAAVATNSLGSNVPYVGASSCGPCEHVAAPRAALPEGAVVVQSQALVWNRMPESLTITALFPNGTVCSTATEGAVGLHLEMTMLSCVGPQMGSLVFKSQSGNCTATIQSSDMSSPFASTFVAGTAADGSGMCVLGTFASLDYSVGASFTCPPCTAL